MVFCCFSCNEPELEAVVPEKKLAVKYYSTRDWDNTPDVYYKTAGNALAATPQQPIVEPATSVAVVPPPAPSPERAQQPKLIAVTVPQNAHPGQTLRVQYGNGQAIEARIPAGMEAGSTFYVQAKENNNPLSSSNSITAAAPVAQSQSQEHPFNNPAATRSAPPPDDPVPFSKCLDDSSDGYGTAMYTSTLGKKVVKVTVPPDTVPGSTIHVRIPGEDNRIIAAIVPPNCSEFNVTYDPTPETTSRRRSNSPLNHFIAPPPKPESKLLLVRVPPGITAGQTLRVQIPGEPGRAVKAVVPPGNVQEFHVSYTPEQR